MAGGGPSDRERSLMFDSLTAGASRALERARLLARLDGRDLTRPPDLLAALVSEPESRAAARLAARGITPETLGLPIDDLENLQETEAEDLPPIAPELRLLVAAAIELARRVDRGREVDTGHLLAALAGSSDPAFEPLVKAGFRAEELISELEAGVAVETATIPMAPEIAPLVLSNPVEAIDLARILDASANRAREGLRVVEDYVRFVLGDPMLTRRLKDCRHRLAEACRGLDPDGRFLDARDTPGDVGTHIMTASEAVRENPRGVLVANFKRAGEALRSLEEYGKLVDVWLSGRFEVLRYDTYTLEKLVLAAVAGRASLGECRLCVLVGGLPTLGDLTWVVEEALAGGADVIQLREKGLSDREFLTRAREVRIVTAKARAKFIVNDRPDLARLAGADGVHLGQDDLTPRDARRVLGPSALIGVSTHAPGQLERAVLDGAGYLGVGPVFASGTKDFERFAGLEYVQTAAETTTLPWFAIGGIDESNIDEVLDAGARRVAVHSAVVRVDRPRLAAAALRRRLDEAPSDDLEGAGD